MRLHIEVRGIVQGVGFRPYCYKLAQQLQLTGWVLNHGQGVSIEVQGINAPTFAQQLETNAPNTARITQLIQHQIDLDSNERHFTIRPSDHSTSGCDIPADQSICKDCLAELFNPNSRFYRHPFINCSQCGPRYSVIKKLPYDRANTSMSTFPLCYACQQDYHSPDNRRFHAQGFSCPQCGPTFIGACSHTNIIQKIITALRDGQVVALKGMSGFHLICDAHNEQAIAMLRARKQRNNKALALMCANIASARQHALLTPEDEQRLLSSQRPIVLVKKDVASHLAHNIAPDTDNYGIMLPYTAMHYLLFHEAASKPQGTDWLQQRHALTLVMTSANLSDEPMIHQAHHHRQLDQLADLIIDHNLTILNRSDDSVIQSHRSQNIFIRRGRAYAPQAISLAYEIPETLALGGHLKNTVCLTRGNQAFVSQPIGDLDNRAAYDFFEETIDYLQHNLGVTPERVAHDLHPDFYSTRYAHTLNLPTHPIQHHHAHLAAVAAEHHITSSALGLALDGYGLGNDANAWGGELFFINKTNFQRIAHLSPLQQPSGELATKQPWRMASGFLASINKHDEITQRYSFPEAKKLQQWLNSTPSLPSTSSCGRLFDTAASLLGIADMNDYEGQAALKLERLTSYPTILNNGWHIDQQRQLNFTPLLTHLCTMKNPTEGANLFHGSLIAGLVELIQLHAKHHDTNIILLSGGCFHNRWLNSFFLNELATQGFKPLLPRQLPPNDGGLSLGQAWLCGIM